MSERISIVVDLAGNLARRARQYSSSLSRFSRSGSSSLSRLSRAARATGGALDRMGNRYTALAAGAAGIGTAKILVDLESRLTAIGIQSDISDQRLEKLKQQLFDIAQSPDVRVDPEKILSGIEEVITRTGEFEVAVENIGNIARTIRATGAAGEDVGALVANLFEKFNIRDAQTMLKMIDSLALQGKAGAFELKDLATQGNRVSAAFAATGRTGPAAVREMGAILQMVRRNTGSADEAATSFERMIATLTQEKVKELQKKGIRIWDAEELKKGNKIARSIPDIIKDIVKATKGDTEKLAEVFDIRALRAINAFALEFKQKGNFESFDRFLKQQGTGAQVMADAARAAKTASAALDSLATSWKALADDALDEPIDKVTKMVNALNGDQLQTGLGLLAGGGGAAVLAAKLGKRSKVVSGAARFAGRGAASAARLAARLAVSPAGAVAGAGLAGAAAGTLLYDKLIAGTAFGDAFGRAVAKALLALTGSEEARHALEVDRRTQGMKGELVIRVEQDGKVRARSFRGERLDVDIDTGKVMVR